MKSYDNVNKPTSIRYRNKIEEEIIKLNEKKLSFSKYTLEVSVVFFLNIYSQLQLNFYFLRP